MPFKDPEKRKEYNKAYRLNYYPKHKEKYSYPGRSKKEREKDPIGNMLHRVKSNAKQRNLEFNLTKEDIIIPEYCPILGIKLSSGKDTGMSNSPSMDRIDNTKGYVKGNVKVISNKANRHKGNLSLEELKNLYEYVLQHTS